MPRESRIASVLLALVVLATALVYAPGIAGFWLGDDYANLQRAYVWALKGETGSRLAGLLSSSVSEGAAFFRPAVIASFTFDFFLHGSNYAGWFFHNLVLHLLNMLLLAALLQRLSMHLGLRAGLGVPLAVALFGLSPLMAEGVYWVSARSDASVTFFALLGLLLWAGPIERCASAIWLPVCLIPALLFKESAALVPLQAGLLWLAVPEIRDRRRGIAVLVGVALVGLFFAWRAHLFGDAWQVYGVESVPIETFPQRLAVAIISLGSWTEGLALAQARVMSLYLALLCLGMLAAVAATSRRLALLALLAAGGGALIATLMNLGALQGNGEGGRLFYTPIAFLSLAVGLGCAKQSLGVTNPFHKVTVTVALAAALSGLALLLPLLQTVWSTQALLRQSISAIPVAAAKTGAMLLLLPDHVGPVVALRNGIAGAVLRPLQDEGLIHKVMPTLSEGLAERYAQYSDGLLDQFESGRIQHWDSDNLPPLPFDRQARWPSRLGCWSSVDGRLIELPAPEAKNVQSWIDHIRTDAAARGCVLN